MRSNQEKIIWQIVATIELKRGKREGKLLEDSKKRKQFVKIDNKS